MLAIIKRSEAYTSNEIGEIVDMNQDTEIQYHKFFVDANQKLIDLPAFHRLKKSGWQIAWSYRQQGDNGPFIETLLQRSFEKQMDCENTI